MQLADAAMLDSLNRAIEAGELKNHQGEPVQKPVEEALVREDGKCVYLVDDGIPNMLIDERVDLYARVARRPRRSGSPPCERGPPRGSAQRA